MYMFESITNSFNSMVGSVQKAVTPAPKTAEESLHGVQQQGGKKKRKTHKKKSHKKKSHKRKSRKYKSRRTKK